MKAVWEKETNPVLADTIDPNYQGGKGNKSMSGTPAILLNVSYDF